MRAKFQNAITRQVRTFSCRSCGFEAPVTVTGVGQGAASSLNRAGTLERRATEDADKDVDRTLAAARCPGCGQRDREGVRRWWMLQGLPLVLVVAFMILLGWLPMIADLNMKASDKPIAGWIVTGIALVTAIPFAFGVWMKWSGVDGRVRFEASDHGAAADG